MMWSRFSKLLPLLILAGGLSATYFLQQTALNAAHQLQQDNFAYQAREIRLRIEQRLAAYEQVLRGIKGLFNASKNVERDEFHDYISNLHLETHYPGIQGVGYSQVIPPQKKNRHIEALRKEGFPNYTLRPEGNRDVYTAIIYLEPFNERNQRAFGYDMYSEAVRRAAMAQARDLDKSTMSGKVRLVQETDQDVQAGFLMYVPVYRNSSPHETLAERRADILGWIYSPFRMNDLMQGVLGEQDSNVVLEIFDGEEATPETLMYDNDGDLTLHPAKTALYHTAQRTELIGHNWLIRLHSLPAFEANLDTVRITVIRLTGAVISVLLSLLIWQLVNGRTRALKLAQNMTRELREREELLRGIMENAHTMIFIKDMAGRYLFVNRMFEDLHQVSNITIQGKTDYDIFPKAIADDITKNDQIVAHSGQPLHTTEHMPHDDGILTYISVKFPLRNISGEIYAVCGIATDITERHNDQQRIEQLLEEQSAILENRLVGIITVRNRKIVWANSAYETMLGYDAGEVIGAPSRQFYVNEEDYLAVGAAYAHIAHDGVVRTQHEFVRKDGERIWLDLSGSVLHKENGESLWIFVDATERKKAEEIAEAASQYARSLIEASLDPLMTINAKGKITDVNTATEQVTGINRANLIGSDFADYFTDPEKAREGYQRVFSQGFVTDYPLAIRHVSGKVTDVLYNANVYRDGNGKVLGVFAAARDITERKQTEQQLRIAATVFESQEGMLVADADNIILRVNHAFTDITGYSAKEVIGKNPRILQSDRHDANFYTAMWQSIHSTGAWDGEVWNRRKNGEIYPEHLTITAVTDPNGIVTHYVATFTDITVSKAAEHEIERLAYSDPLTGLPNRRQLQNRLTPALASSKRSGRKGALLFIDLDNFKTLNDTLGHDMGDLLLQQVAKRLTSSVRECDTVARLGGDEFVVMLEDLSEQAHEAAAQAETVGNKILAILNQPYRLGAYDYHNTPSIGATLFDGHRLSIDELLKQADNAMYQAKSAGRNTLRFFEPQMPLSMHARIAMTTNKRRERAGQQT